MRISLLVALLSALTGCAAWTQHPQSPSAGESAALAPVTARIPATGSEPVTGPEDTASKGQSQSPSAPESEFDDIWDRIRAGFQLRGRDHPYLQRELREFTAHPQYLRLIQRRAEPFLYLILQEVERRGMPTELALLPAVESAYYPQAYSPNHAAGLWQFIPRTARHFGLRENWWYDGRRDVLASTRAALDYLQRLHRRFGGDWELALAAYNAGQGSVGKAMRRNSRRGKATDFQSLDLPLETRLYVPRLLALCRIIDNPDDYGITLKPIANRPRLAVVDTQSQLDLALAAEMAGISGDELRRLNPGFDRWATAPDGPHHLLVPADQADGFRARLRRLDPAKRIQWTRYRIRPGDSLSVIARKHRLSVAHLQKVNKLRGTRIRAGRYLLIPTPSDQDGSAPTIPEAYLAKKSAPQTKGTPLSYTVRPGDTLWDIGRAFKVSYLDLAQWNDLTPDSTLRPRQKLLIWKQTGY